jgi:hypothetical protein
VCGRRGARLIRAGAYERGRRRGSEVAAPPPWRIGWGGGGFWECGGEEEGEGSALEFRNPERMKELRRGENSEIRCSKAQAISNV